MRLATFAALSGILGLAACGGGTSGGGSPSPEPTLSLLQSDFNRLATAHPFDSPVTRPDQMPVAGGATFRGAALYSGTDTIPVAILAAPTSASQVELTANFGTSQVGGRLFDFRNADPSVATNGELALSGAIGNNIFVGSISGMLDVDGVPTDHSGGSFFGTFVGADHRAVSGQIQQDASPTQYNGIFIAER